MHTKTSNVSHSLVLQKAMPVLLSLRGIGPLSGRGDDSDELHHWVTDAIANIGCTRIIICPKKRT